MRHALLLTLAFAAAFTAGAIAQTTAQPGHPPLAIRSLAGKDLFDFYCASCHGRDGSGDGPVAAALRTAPPDLRLLARRNLGVFPQRKAEAYVSGEGVAQITAHGTGEMPVWGPVFRALDPDEAMAAIRIRNLIDYLSSIQRSRP